MDVRRSPLIAAAIAGLALGSGCVSAGAKKTETKQPDVMQPGALPPPQETTRDPNAPAPAAGGVVPASASVPAAPAAPTPPAPAGGGTPSPFAKLTSRLETKLIATDFAVGWQNRVAYLPDPVNSGRMSPGLVGQMYLFGGPKLEFVPADGVLTVDLVDISPRAPGQPPATPERWQFPKSILKELQATDDTFGKSYVLFLPWPAYKPDITRVRIAARYSPESGPTLYAEPSVVTLDSKPYGTPVATITSTDTVLGPGVRPPGLPPTGGTMPVSGPPIPLGGGPRFTMPPGPAAGPFGPPPGDAAPLSPLPPVAPAGFMPGVAPVAPPLTSPTGLMPGTPPAGAMAPPAVPLPNDVPPLTLTLPSRQ